MILITGGTGMLGKSLSKFIDGKFIGSKEYDLRKKDDVIKCFEKYKPKKVIHLAAKVGGIINNKNHQYDFYLDNVLINTNIIDACLKFNVEHILTVSSTCVYPSIVHSYPMTEDMVHDGLPEKTNLTYAYSKRMMEIQLEAARQQFGLNSCNLYCSNMYGPNDCFNENECHLVPALISKMHNAKISKNDIELHGTGKPLRQFTYVDDFAEIIHMAINANIQGSYNVSTDENLSVLDIAQSVSSIIGFNGNMSFSNTLDGQFRKDVSCNKLFSEIKPFNFTPLKLGLEKTYKWYKENL